MSIPSQNDFLLPFLNFLSDGKAYTRRQLRDKLIQHFQMSETDTAQTLGHQNALTSRIAWCDVHFSKAGFIKKLQSFNDSLEDSFTITSLGVRELRQRSDKITVGYLRSFYLSKIHRGAGSDDTTSDAELELYDALENLTNEYEIFHSVKWFAKQKGTIGEIDFLIGHPQYGLLVLEVKGGIVQLQNGEWYSTNRFGKTNPIANPCEQAERNRWALRDWLDEDPRTKRYRYSIFPAVALPDSRVERDLAPNAPKEIFVDIRHLADLRTRIRSIFAYWQAHTDQRNQYMDGRPALIALVDLFEPTRNLQPKIADIFERERRKIEEITQGQFNILRLLRQRKRAAIVGGAGTGKTMLAMEKVQQLLNADYRVLFLCFNQQLKQWLEKNLKHPQLVVTTFHGLVGYATNWARIPKPRGDFYEQSADLLYSASQVLQAQNSERLFDAIIVDEGQDFEDTWWLAIPELLKDREAGVFYIFFDDNQRIYQQMSNIPIREEPLQLPDNCRNTQHIHAQMTAYTRQDMETICLGPEGRPVEVLNAENAITAKRELQRLLHRLINDEGLKSEDIVLLTGTGKEKSLWKQDEMLGNFILSWDMETEMEGAIRVSTIHAYKGLESAVVILSELGKVREEIRNPLIYVGLSRARHHAIVLENLPSAK